MARADSVSPPCECRGADAATGSVDLFCSDGQLPNETINQSGPTPFSESCEDTIGFGGSGSRSARAAATSLFGASPSASATADAGVTVIQYQLQVIQIAAPPVGGITEVPIVLAASGAATASTVSGLAGSTGESFVRLSGPGVDVVEGASDGVASFPANTFDSLLAIPNIEIGSAYTLTVHAQCSADASSAPR